MPRKKKTPEQLYQDNYERYQKLIGKKFGKLTVEEILGLRPNKNGRQVVFCRCKCDCGNYKETAVTNLLTKPPHGVTSCGCARFTYTEPVYCKICGASSEDDPNFLRNKQLCCMHASQLYYHGKIVSVKRRKKYHKEEKCDICGATESSEFYFCNKEGEWYGKTLCARHDAQMRTYGKIVDPSFVPYIPRKKPSCSICGSKEEVWYIGESAFCINHIPQNAQKAKSPFRFQGDNVYFMLFNQKGEKVGETLTEKKNFEKVSGYKWSLSSGGYAQAIKNKKTTLFQYLIKENPSPKENKTLIDHINQNKLDNREENLRITSYSVNLHNKKTPPGSKTGVTGVIAKPDRKGYTAQISVNRKFYYLGYFKNFEDAVKARLEGEKRLCVPPYPQQHLFAQYGIEENEEENK